jgi:NAD(P)H-flavin reductase
LESKSSCQVTVLLEGPYGASLDLSSYSNVLVIAGASGITAAISHTHHVLQSESVSVHIIWAVPQKHLVDDVSAHELAAVLGHPRVNMEVYLTGAAVVADDAITPRASYKVHFGRPDVLAVMAEARSKCSSNLAIVSCGTPPMSDACRRAVVEILKQDSPEVGYFDETMTW